MVKILLADTDTKRNSASCQFLSNEKDFEIESTNDGISTIKKYLEIEPNIFVIDSNFIDIKTLDIIDRLSVSPLERRKKNTILTISKTKETFLLENVLKVYQVLYRPFDNNKLLNIINQMKLEFSIPNLTEEELNMYLLPLDFNINSNGCHYLKSAILHSYYYSNKFNSLDDIFSNVALEYGISTREVRDGIRSALIPFNRYKNYNSTKPIMKFFDLSKDPITPKYFISTFVTYLRLKKARNK